MRTRRATRPVRGRRALLTLAGLALVLGLLGMHTLALHGVSGEHAADGGDGATSSGPSAHAGHQVLDRRAPTGAEHTRVAAGDDRSGHGTGHAMMLCVAMIAAAAGAVLLQLLLRRVPRSRWRVGPRRVGAPARGLAPERLATGPPAVWEFSVIRC